MTLPDAVDAVANLPPRELLAELSDMATADEVERAVLDADDLDVAEVIWQLVDEVREHRKLLAALVVMERGAWAEAHRRVLGEDHEVVDPSVPPL